MSNQPGNKEVCEVEGHSSDKDSYSREEDQIPGPAKVGIKKDGAVHVSSVAFRHVPRQNHLWLIEYDEAIAEARQDHDQPKDGHQISSITDVEDEDKDVQKVDGERQPE